MKLIFCPDCSDVVKFGYPEKRYCKCGASWGQYKEDGWYATMGGKTIPLGFANLSLALALKNQPKKAPGQEFTAFVIEKNCPRIEVIKDVKRSKKKTKK